MHIKKIIFNALLPIQSLFIMYLYSESIINQDLLKHVLLVINFNQPHYENIPFLKKIYKPYFKNIVFYGPKAHPEVNRYDSKKSTYWHFSYATLIQAIEQYQDYDGYFWLNDDCALFAWQLRGLDATKIWMSPAGFKNIKNLESGVSNLAHNNPKDFWQFHYYHSKLEAIYNQLPKHLKNNIIENYGEHIIPWGPAEGCYIPYKYVQDFLTIAKLCLQEGIIVEQALHFIIACLDTKKNQETLNISWTETIITKDCTPIVSTKYELIRHPFFRKIISEHIALFHHMKFSHQKNRNLLQFFYQVMTESLHLNHAKRYFL